MKKFAENGKFALNVSSIRISYFSQNGHFLTDAFGARWRRAFTGPLRKKNKVTCPGGQQLISHIAPFMRCRKTDRAQAHALFVQKIDSNRVQAHSKQISKSEAYRGSS